MTLHKTLETIKKRVSYDYEDYPIIKYLKILQPTWTKVFAMKMIRTKNVLVNSEKTSINYKLQAGDLIELYGSREIPKEGDLNLKKLKKLNVLFENEYLIIVDKEEKISVQSDEKNYFNNMNNRLLNHLNWEPSEDSWKPVFVHRLDYNTTGLLIGAKTYKAFVEITNALKNQKIHKYYKALVHGLVSFKQTTLNLSLLKQENKTKVVPKGTIGSKEAITEITLLKHNFQTKSSLLDLKLITGRTHQIRAHLQHINHPIKGDQKYGTEKDKKSFPYPALVAYKIIFDQDIEGETLKDLKGKTIEKKNFWFQNLD